MRIVHLTDAHLSTLGGVSPAALRGKRLLGYLSWWRRRRHQFDAGLLAPLTAAVAAEAPTLIVITGDLVHIGLGSEIAEAAQWLAQLRAIAEVVLVPGNHDLYAPDSSAHVQRHLGAYLHGVALGPEGHPSLLRRGEVCVIGLSSARPMPWWSAGGALGAAQLARLTQMLADSAGMFRCIVLHHPPLPDQAPRRKALADAAKLAAILSEHGVELVLHGHLHRNDAHVHGGCTRVMVTAPALSTMPGRPASFRVFDIASDHGHWLVDARLKTLLPNGTVALAAEQRWQHLRRPLRLPV